MGKKKRGRKIFDGKDIKLVLAKLEEAFGINASDEEACFYAGISTSSLHNWETYHPEFRQRKWALKERMVLVARQIQARAIESGDVEEAREYLKSHRKEEFSTKLEVEHSGNLTIEGFLAKIEERYIKRINVQIVENKPPLLHQGQE